MNNDKRRIAQELDVSFLGSGGNVIDDEDIQRMELTHVEDPIFIDRTYFDGHNGLVRIWEEPIPEHQYILAADVARGDGEDSSAFVILDFTTMTQVCEYQGKIQPDLFAGIINQYGLHYNAYVVVDNIGIGTTTALKLVEMKYPNLHYDKMTPKIAAELHENDVLMDTNKVAGFNVNGVRLNLIAHLEYMVRTLSVKVRSKALVSEMRTFIYKPGGRPDHMEGYHDDLLFSLGMALWILEHSFKKLEKATSQTKAMLSAWIMNGSGDALPSTNTFVTQQNRGKAVAPQPKFSPVVSKNMQDPSGTYAWLFSGMIKTEKK